MTYTTEQLKAAYALNLCTISISQIIDYNDVNIMEQEYDAILNNLNLEQMPKDESLLKILKQLLDTITFFRISDKEREFIEKGYKQKMKNAIWSAVPNIGLIIGGGDWKTIALAIASQVGIGYMNYRRAKADGEFEREKQLWQLERSAIEQFNGLRRELFDTAWRLSAAYNYPDELRLTERQIKQYNNILMDCDPVRRYERLMSISDHFIAYPPFWYYLGHTAVELSFSELGLSDEKKKSYKGEAIQHFIQYRATNQQGLLREDPVSSACALEYIDLLDPVTDKRLILELIDEAYSFSGRKEDILQLCAMAYLRIGEKGKAAWILKQLINEEYIPYMNAQLLSGLYVSSYIDTDSPEALEKYNLLQRQIGAQYLVPMPDNMAVGKTILNQQFIENQRQMLLIKYKAAMNELWKKYSGRYAKLVPVKMGQDDRVDYYSLTNDEKKELFMQLKSIFDKATTADEYRRKFQEIDIQADIIDLLNDQFVSVSELGFVDDALQSTLAGDIEKTIIAQRFQINSIIGKLQKGKFEFADIGSLLRIEYRDFTGSFYEDLNNAMNSYINSLSEMQDFAIAEQSLVEICGNNQLNDPEKLYAQSNSIQYAIIAPVGKKFSIDLWGQKSEQFNMEAQRKQSLLSTIEKYQSSIVTAPEKAEFYSAKDPRIVRYFSSNGQLYNCKGLRQRTIAILDAKGKKGGFDLVFTDAGVIPYKDRTLKPQVLYKDIRWKENNNQSELQIGEVYKGYVADLKVMYQMIQELSRYSFVPAQGTPVLDVIMGALGIKK